MTTIQRHLAGVLLAIGAILAAAAGARAQTAAPKVFRIGYQKVGLIVITRQQGSIEKRLAAQGIAVEWIEFQAGPPLLEAINAGSIDFGYTGDAPPIFAQAAGSKLVYVSASAPSGDGEAILVKEDSPIHSVSDLKGRRVAVGRGTSAHNLLIAAVEKAGLNFSDITPAYLLPADAGSAFANDSVDAWAVWDPYFALAQARNKTRVLTTSGETLNVSAYFLADRTFAERHPAILASALGGLSESAAWADANREQVAQSLATVTGVPYAIQKVAADRTQFAVRILTEDIVTKQQATADRFHRLGLIPRAIQIRDAVWTAPRT